MPNNEMCNKVGELEMFHAEMAKKTPVDQLNRIERTIRRLLENEPHFVSAVKESGIELDGLLSDVRNLVKEQVPAEDLGLTRVWVRVENERTYENIVVDDPAKVLMNPWYTVYVAADTRKGKSGLVVNVVLNKNEVVLPFPLKTSEEAQKEAVINKIRGAFKDGYEEKAAFGRTGVDFDDFLEDVTTFVDNLPIGSKKVGGYVRIEYKGIYASVNAEDESFIVARPWYTIYYAPDTRLEHRGEYTVNVIINTENKVDRIRKTWETLLETHVREEVAAEMLKHVKQDGKIWFVCLRNGNFLEQFYKGQFIFDKYDYLVRDKFCSVMVGYLKGSMYMTSSRWKNEFCKEDNSFFHFPDGKTLRFYGEVYERPYKKGQLLRVDAAIPLYGDVYKNCEIARF